MHRSFLGLMVAGTLSLLLLSGCDQEGNLSLTGKAAELEASSKFQVSTRPMLSRAQAVSTLLQGTGFAAQGQASLPGYSDIEFFPIASADAVEALRAYPRGRGNDAPIDLSGIDFDKSFAFLVAHPSSSSYGAITSGQHATFFSSVLPSYEKDKVVLRIDASRLGEIDPMTALGGNWEGSIYAVERRGRDKLEVRLYDESYVYSLAADAAIGVPEGAAATAR
ncbi:hypothetical protein [Stenotrophomonas pigmentata]|uniref:hypothetical protein n=1 Tax=Stenotrophomonas pigmentata TaxID=3055080 RepID=UPI0026EE531A|nr:hypothetical protein [Stenotrophomonas sp. 610A2]